MEDKLEDKKVLFKYHKMDVTISDERGGVFSTGGEFENERHKPSISITFKDANWTWKDIEERQKFLSEFLQEEMRRREAESWQKSLEKRISDIKWYPISNGLKFASVTSIINEVNPIKWWVDDHQRRGLAARGQAGDIVLQQFFKTGIWMDPKLIPEAYRWVEIMKTEKIQFNGNLPAWYEKYQPKFTKGHFIVINHEYRYAGEPDLSGTLSNITTLFELKWFYPDEKARVRAFKQLAAYAMAMDIPPEQLCIISIHDKAKQGYSAPIVTTDIQAYWEMFLQDRSEFKKMFNI